MERLRADFRHLRFLLCLTSQAGAPSACACYPNPSSKAKILGALLAVGESRAIFHPASQESLFRRKLCQAFCNISYSQACPLAFLTEEHFVRRQLMTHLHLPIKRYWVISLLLFHQLAASGLQSLSGLITLAFSLREFFLFACVFCSEHSTISTGF